MKLRLLALTAAIAGVTAATFAAGCKEDDTQATPTPDAGKDGRTTDEAGNPSGECPGPVVAELLQWKAPTKTNDNACQADDLDAMREFLTKEPQATNEDFENFVKNRDTVCHDCMFAESSGATWPPFPMKDNKVVTFNIGACYALVSGRESCGKAIQNEFDCEFESCAACTSQGDLDACRKKARTGVCASFNNETSKQCAGLPVRVDDVCGSIFDSVRVQCISLTADPDGGITDAGTDG